MITADSASEYVIGSQALIPGSAIIVSGTPVSPGPSALVIGSSTHFLTSTAAPLLTIGGSTITANSASQYLISGQTLIPGGSAIIVSRTPISLLSLLS